MRFFELTPAILQSAFIVLIMFLTIFVESPKLRQLKQFTSSAARLSALKTGLVLWWSYALLALALSGPNDLFQVRRTNADIGWLLANPVLHTLVIILLAAYFCLAFSPALRCALNPKLRQKCGKAMRSLHFILPVSNSERRQWVLLCITAGVCEEVIFRGFLLQYLHGQLSGGWNLDLTSAWLLSSLAFGCAHFYQGPARIAPTALGGLLFGLLAILSGSLFLPIVLHILADLAVLWMYHPRLDNPDMADRLMQGCTPNACES